MVYYQPIIFSTLTSIYTNLCSPIPINYFCLFWIIKRWNVWQLLLNIIVARSIYAVASGSSSFIFILWIHYNVFVNYIAYEHLHTFHFESFKSMASVCNLNISTCIQVYTFMFHISNMYLCGHGYFSVHLEWVCSQFSKCRGWCVLLAGYKMCTCSISLTLGIYVFHFHPFLDLSWVVYSNPLLSF